ncbi:MAG: translation initiation factor eIF-2B [Anaerolineales bacterium]|jgi:translation initiation factor 2B subunit (eIF-2B alpha/beta/delta family)
MSTHKSIETVIDRIHRDLIGGAADIAKEVVVALAQMTQDSQADSAEKLLHELEPAVTGILKVMSSFAPPVNAMNRLLVVVEEGVEEQTPIDDLKVQVQDYKDEFLGFAEHALVRIAQIGAEIVEDGDTVFMYSMSSTVWRILEYARKQGKTFKVIVTESRPGNEGLWTVDKMKELEIPVAVSIDACVGEIVPEADVVFVGADAIASSGVTLCKVGTYPVALVAARHGVPFYVAADTLKFDATTLIGLPFVSEPVEHFRHQVFPDESYAETEIVGTMFDETPPALIAGIISEIGILPAQACATIMQEISLSQMMQDLLPKWARGEL